ncbi:hypothetical protein C1M51_02900 [Methylibium sp. Pch-M]|uniref:hypothetical protein n=1 Tax=Methylibium sp. Pch-M TaxID=2082386 RepID=UPI001012F1B7|nr:hypothetical protein [Methylibium sp. Pch-M]QAZ38453.1 hypothetical protein C1M51_02900 [Methylibium sp. Pch-M]
MQRTKHPTKSGPGRQHGQGVAHPDYVKHRNGRSSKDAGRFGKGLRAAITRRQKQAIDAKAGAA